MLMFQSNRWLLKKYVAKSETNEVWEQEESLTKGFYPTDIYEYEMVEKLMKISSNIAEKFADTVEYLLKNRNMMKKTKVTAIFQEAQLISLLSAVLKIGSNPKVDYELLQDKIGAPTFEKLFDQQAKNSKVEFLLIMLVLYADHITLCCQTQKLMKTKFFKDLTEFITTNRNSKKNKGIEKFGNSLDTITQNDFLISDFTIEVDTRHALDGYKFEENTMVPGTFFNFCKALAMKDEDTEHMYANFGIKPIEEREEKEKLDEDYVNETDGHTPL